MNKPTRIPSYYGYNAPFVGGKQGFLSQQVDEQLIRNDLLQLLLTAPGERVMRPDFGAGIRPFLFEGIDNASVLALQENIKQTIEQYENRVNVSSVTIAADPDNNLIKIIVYGSFKFDQYNPGNPADSNVLVELNIPTGKITTSLG
jgi:phage baseplate assembly protein W